MDHLAQVIQQLEDLKSLFIRDWPKYCKEYYCLDNFLDLHKWDTQLEDVKVYTLPNLGLGLFVIVDRHQIFVVFLEAERSESVLKESLLKLDFFGGEQFASMPKRYLTVANDIIQEKNLKLQLDSITYSMVLSKEEAQYFQVEATVGFSLKSVSLDDAYVINNNWEWSELSGSLSYIQRQIGYNTSVGLYKDENNELVAWCIRVQDGLLAALQVKPIYKRRGFGAMIVKEYSRREAVQGHDTITEVGSENKASLNLFTKLGFRINDQCHWLYTEAPNGD
ncbi:uncharacterized protein [Drosophila takahashii]|uniref:uncharacterized protein n=1 Tax=Drosophila takahashii TaxID=29030 RepID=UPI003899364E